MSGDHRCVVCGAYGTRSPNNGKDWYCWQHDPSAPKSLFDTRVNQQTRPYSADEDYYRSYLFWCDHMGAKCKPSPT